MNEHYTFHECVAAIDRATLTGRVFPRSFRDNGPESRLLCLDWARTSDRDGWLDYFGALPAETGDYSRWARDWHGWSVLMTAHFNDANDETAGAAVLREARPVVPVQDPDDIDSPYYLTLGRPVVPVQDVLRSCAQATQHEGHPSHTRHVGASSRWCEGWNAPTVQMATVPA